MEPAAPIRPAQHGHRAGFGGVVFGSNQASDRRFDSEHVEEAAVNILDIDVLPFRGVSAQGCSELDRGRKSDQSRQYVIVVSQVLVDFEVSAVEAWVGRELVEQLDKPPRVAHGKRAQQQGVEQAENGGVGADAESQRENRDGGEGGRATHRSQAVADVLPEPVERIPAPHFAGELLDVGAVAELAADGAFGGLGRLAAFDAVARRHGEMRLDLFVEVLVPGFGRMPWPFHRAGPSVGVGWGRRAVGMLASGRGRWFMAVEILHPCL